MILHLALLVQCRLVTDGRTDRRSDGQTQDDSIYFASIALCKKMCQMLSLSSAEAIFHNLRTIFIGRLTQPMCSTIWYSHRSPEAPASRFTSGTVNVSCMWLYPRHSKHSWNKYVATSCFTTVNL